MAKGNAMTRFKYGNELMAGDVFVVMAERFIAIQDPEGPLKNRIVARRETDDLICGVQLHIAEELPVIAHVYPVGTRVGEIREFDRSTKVNFTCPDHRSVSWASKDPFVSTWFPRRGTGDQCNCPVSNYVTDYEYRARCAG